jgi:hypothetical protein
MEVEADINHGSAAKVKKKIENSYGLPVTTNLVVAETITLLRLKAGFDEAVAFGEKVFASKSLQVVMVDEGIEKSAWRIFRKYSDKRLSFADCASFAVMRELRITRAFTFDDRFSQLGFEAVRG